MTFAWANVGRKQGGGEPCQHGSCVFPLFWSQSVTMLPYFDRCALSLVCWAFLLYHLLEVFFKVLSDTSTNHVCII